MKKSAKRHFFLFHVQNQSLQIFPFRMVNANRMVGRLRELV